MIKTLLPAPIAIVYLLLIAVSGWAETYHSPNGYSITAPRDWSVKESGNTGSDTILITRERDGFASNVNVRVDSASAGLTLEQIQAQLKTLYPKNFTKYKSLSERFTSVGRERAYEVLFNHDHGTPPRTLWVRQDVAIHQGKVYIFTCTSLASNSDRFTSQFDWILYSVRWTSSEAPPEHKRFRKRRYH